MINLLQYEFMQNAFLAAFLASILCGMMGSLVVVRKHVIVAGGIAHGAYGGVGLAFFLGVSPIFGTMVFSLVLSLLIAWITWQKPERADSIIGVLWAVGMAIGVICIDLTPGYGADLMSYLFGSILTVSKGDLFAMLGVILLSFALGFLYHKELLAFAYDPDFAKTRGVPVAFLHYVVIILISMTVVLLIRVVGLILVIALLTIPPSIAERWSHSLYSMMGRAFLLSLFFSFVGLWLSALLNVTAGATIILVSAIGYALSLLLKK
ncbi:MAG: metal ABC transporter permease [Aminobacterium sp.]|jgi:zinc transport system permease protein|uniref:metal ABC transporter permease n=1 Tax=Aminobacterium sp. MB27-C1 TaxID=3070661 RepID=UPI001BCC71BC|nr:metal ABC transporter permease [Aminobacterium sp. MB27-C1]MDD2207657.1 metal ABC transporter permease [Aminobacterium sp.]MDD3427217.1 metal ABC transporter permease [Aminobacterium sp.]MDD3708367.1 metal ABC transporter permease [Aminobacterium sp.]MDD4229686.1 metal ABC transporter permease [Aminobacterium sp.]MDD4552500.1 metal ABC transporter permease [Aminobacterium sp.]